MNPKSMWLSRKQKRMAYIVAAVLFVSLFVWKVPLNSEALDAEFKNRNDMDSTILGGGGHIPGRRVEKSAEVGVPSIKDYTQDIARKLAIEKATKDAIAADKKSTKKKLKNTEVLDSLSTYSAKADYDLMIESSPVVIFSKSYCPYSKKLKALLSKEYKITPEPFVLELDLYEHGTDLQAHVGKVTKRTTVPNLIVDAVSYGGCDDIVALHENGELLQSLKQWLGAKGSVTALEKA